jgi:hypothetical protein
VVVTTLMDAAAVTGADLAGLYRRRWQAELHLRSLKQSLQMDILRGHPPGNGTMVRLTMVSPADQHSRTGQQRLRLHTPQPVLPAVFGSAVLT